MTVATGTGDGLTVAELTHAFGQQRALDDVHLTVRTGEVVGLVGRNGAGKTTTMRAIMGVLRPHAGTVHWRGHLVTAADRRHFGYMPEERGLYPQMPLADQLVYLARLHGVTKPGAEAAAEEWIVRMSLAGRERDRIIALSHGNQQRAQLAAALVHDPSLAILDEPFAGLDPEAVDVLSGVLRERARGGVAVLFSSHQLELVEEICDRVVVMDEGRIKASGTLAELRSSLPQHLRVRVRSVEPWRPHTRGVEVVAEGADGVLLTLAPGVDDQEVLREAQAAGAVEHFGFEAADLSEVFRAVVAR